MVMVVIVMIVMVMVMRRRKEEMRDPVSQRIHHEFWNGEEVVSAESSFVMSIQLLESMPEFSDVALTGSSFCLQ